VTCLTKKFGNARGIANQNESFECDSKNLEQVEYSFNKLFTWLKNAVKPATGLQLSGAV
jgi:hypothetical protein